MNKMNNWKKELSKRFNILFVTLDEQGNISPEATEWWQAELIKFIENLLKKQRQEIIKKIKIK